MLCSVVKHLGSGLKDSKLEFKIKLSKHIWHLKDSKLEFKITWKILNKLYLSTPLRTAVICACGKNILSFVNLT